MGLIIAAVGGVAGLWLLSRGLSVLLSPEQLTEFANYALDREYETRHRVRLDDVEVDLLGRSVAASHVRLEMAPGATDPGSAGEPEAVVEVDSLIVRRVSPLELILGSEFRAAEVRLVRPRVELRWARDSSPPNSVATDSSRVRTTRDVRSVMEEVAGRFPSAVVGQFAIVDGTLLLANDAGFELAAGGIDLSMIALDLDSSEIDRPDGALFSDRLRFSAHDLRHRPARGGYVARASRFDLSSVDSTLTITGIDLDTAAYDPLPGGRLRSDRFDLFLATLTLSGIDYRGMFAGPRIFVRVARVDSASLEVFSDKRLPAGPSRPASLPHDLVRSLPIPLRVDTVAVERTRIEYVERAPQSAKPGRLVFDDVWVSAINVNNDSTRMTGRTPTVINANGILAGESRLTTVLQLDLLAPAFDLRYRGRLGPFDVRAINSILIDVEGVRITGGVVDSLWFDASVRNGMAAGSLTAAYRNLSIEMVDRRSGRPDILDRVKSLVANAFVIEGSNVPDGQGRLRMGTVDYATKPADTFFGRIWFGLRSGLLALIGSG